MNVVDFPIERCSIIGGPANDNPEPTALVCALCKCNVFRAWLREGAFVIECAYCHVAVTEGVLAYAFGQQGLQRMSKAVIHCQQCGAERLLSPSHAKVRKYCSPECGFAARTEASRRDGGTSAAHWHQPDREKRCIRCGEEKALGEFYACSYTTRQGKRLTRYESRCKPCARKRRTAERNVEREARTHQAWREANKEHVRAYNREKQKDPRHRALKAKAQRLRKARMRSGQGDTPEIRAIYAQAMREEAVIQATGCPVFALPELGFKLHVDHIRPLARGGQHVADNLQILPAGINCRKWAHYD